MATHEKAFNNDFLTDEELEQVTDTNLRLKPNVADQLVQSVCTQELKLTTMITTGKTRPMYDVLHPHFGEEVDIMFTALRKKFKVPHNLRLFNPVNLPLYGSSSVRHLPIMVEIFYKRYCLEKSFAKIVEELSNPERTDGAPALLESVKNPENLLMVMIWKTIHPSLVKRMDEFARHTWYKEIAQQFVQGKARAEVAEYISKNHGTRTPKNVIGNFFNRIGKEALASFDIPVQESLRSASALNSRGWWSASVAAFLHKYGDVSVPEAIKIAKKLNVRAMPEDFRRYKVSRKRVDK